MKSAILTIEFKSWWLGGTGRSGGEKLDAVAYRDRFGCPALPMTQVKGILRDTAENLGLLKAEKLFLYFGKAHPSRSQPDNELAWKQKSENGEIGAGDAKIRFSGDASIAIRDREFFAAAPAARASLFSVMRSTAIDKTGVALTDSLRSIEVCVPVTLSKRIDWIGDEPPSEWIADLDRICALTPAFGKLRNDGYGRAIARCGALS